MKKSMYLNYNSRFPIGPIIKRLAAQRDRVSLPVLGSQTKAWTCVVS